MPPKSMVFSIVCAREIKVRVYDPAKRRGLIETPVSQLKTLEGYIPKSGDKPVVY